MIDGEIKMVAEGDSTIPYFWESLGNFRHLSCDGCRGYTVGRRTLFNIRFESFLEAWVRCKERLLHACARHVIVAAGATQTDGGGEADNDQNGDCVNPVVGWKLDSRYANINQASKTETQTSTQKFVVLRFVCSPCPKVKGETGEDHYKQNRTPNEPSTLTMHMAGGFININTALQPFVQGFFTNTIISVKTCAPVHTSATPRTGVACRQVTFFGTRTTHFLDDNMNKSWIISN